MAEEAKLGFLKLFPAGFGKKPKEGEIPPSEASGAGRAATCALAQQAPIDATVPRGLGMTQLFRDPAKWIAVAGDTCPDYSDCGEETSCLSNFYLGAAAAPSEAHSL